MNMKEDLVSFIKGNYFLIFIAFIIYLLSGFSIINSVLMTGIATISSVFFGNILYSIFNKKK